MCLCCSPLKMDISFNEKRRGTQCEREGKKEEGCGKEDMMRAGISRRACPCLRVGSVFSNGFRNEDCCVRREACVCAVTNYKAPLECFKLPLQTHKRSVERLDGVRVGRGLHTHEHHVLERVRDLVARKHHVGVAHQLAVAQNAVTWLHCWCSCMQCSANIWRRCPSVWSSFTMRNVPEFGSFLSFS